MLCVVGKLFVFRNSIGIGKGLFSGSSRCALCVLFSIRLASPCAIVTENLFNQKFTSIDLGMPDKVEAL
jgi:hypothetical protein